MPEAPEKNLALDIVRITEAAALSSARWLGRGNKEAGDGAAVDAMRNSFSTLHVDGMWSSVKAKRTTPPCCTTVKRSAWATARSWTWP